MSVYLITFLVMLGAAIIIAGVVGMSALRRVLSLKRHAKKLQNHPTLEALRTARTVAERLQGLQPRIEEIGARSQRIALTTSELIGRSAVLRLQVDRVGFATRLLLETFVPTLRGSMAD